MACINPNSPEFKEILSKVNNPLLAEIEMDKSISINDINIVDNNISALENKLIDGFLKDFNITATEYESLKTDLGVDAYSMSDLITKSIAYEQGESILPEVAYFAYSMLGKQNSKLRSELKYLVNKWNKYKERFEYHKNIVLRQEGFIDNKKQWQSKVRDLVILDFLNESINLHYTNPQQFIKQLDSKWTYEDFTLWNKIVTWIEDLLSSYSKKYKNRKEKLTNIGISIADEILNQNYEYFDYNIKEGQLQKYYTETINKDAFAKEFTTYCREQLNFILTGSLALRKAGSVYRTVDENIHDIDYVIPYELTNTSKNKKYLESIRNHTGEDVNFSSLVTMENVQKFDWYKKFIAKYPTYKIINGFYGEEHGNFQSYTLTGVIDGEYYTSNGKHEEEVSYYRKDPVTKKPMKIKKIISVNHKKGDLIKDTGYVVDFFIRLTPNQEEHTNYFKLWKEIMIAKLKMGRDKDFIDWKMFVPFLKSKDKFNFNYEGYRHINYKNSQVNAFEDVSSNNDSLNNPTIQEAVSWIKSVMPDANIELVNDLIDGIGTGSYDTVKDLITLSEKYANKKTAKHEVFHKAFNSLSKEKQEELLDEGSKLFGIPRGESKVTVKYSKAEQYQIDYMLKSVDLLQSEKAVQLFKTLEKNKVSGDVFWKKVQELGIPKDQIELLKQYNTTNKEELITNMLADYSFIVESNVSYDNQNITNEYAENPDYWFEYESIRYYKQSYYDGNSDKYNFFKKDINDNDIEEITELEYNTVLNKYNKQNKKSSKYYSNLTVPGGTNYTEQEISTPAITPSIKGHAQFATDKGIGWFRSDDKIVNYAGKPIEFSSAEEYEYNKQQGLIDGPIIDGRPTQVKPIQDVKTRRILEVQSDLFQKGRDRQILTKAVNKVTGEPTYDYSKEKEPNNKPISENQNQFLQLLNKNNNWITFFVKSIILDSAKKGYEKVLFPTGNTASKVEGHSTLEEFKKQKEDRIKELEYKKYNIISGEYEKEINKKLSNFKNEYDRTVKLKKDGKLYDNFIFTNFPNKIFEQEQLLRDIPSDLINIDNELNQLKQELERVETEGFGVLKPIYNFYENTVTNILNKVYGKENVKAITDEFGNTWNEITITPAFLNKIKLQSTNLQYIGDLAIEEKMAEMMENTSDEELPKSILGKWIQSVRNFFRNLFKERDRLQRFMRDINQGRYANQRSNGIGSGKRYSQLSKQNVQDLFETDVELADKVYSALDYNQNIIQDNNSYYRGQLGEPTLDSNGNLILYPESAEWQKKLTGTDKGVSLSTQLSDAEHYGSWRFGQRSNQIMEEFLSEYDQNNELEQLEETGYTLIQIDKDVMDSMEKVQGKENEDRIITETKITIPKGKFKIERFNSEGKIVDVTKQQQAVEIYSQYLQSLNKPDTNPILQDKQQEQVKKFAELQERLNNKEFVEGTKNVYDNSKELQELGTQEQYIDFIAKVALGIVRNPSSGEFNDSKVIDVVYHGGSINFDKDVDNSDMNDHFGYGMYSSNNKNQAERHGAVSALILNIVNPANITQTELTNFITPIINEKGFKEGYIQQAKLFKDIRSKSDGIIGKDDFTLSEKDNKEYVVFNPNQIHILSSKQDIEGFKQHVSTVDNKYLNDIKNSIRDNLPVEISSVITVVNEVPIEILGRDDLYLSIKEFLIDNGIKDEVLINWVGINKDRFGHPKNIKSTEQLLSIINKRYDELKDINNHPELKRNALALDSFNKWVIALERYPIAFREVMLTHAVKYLNPLRRAKYVLQLSDVALMQTYGILVGKPHELNRMGKLYDKEVVATLSDAVKHEPSASGKGYWVHIPRTSPPVSIEETQAKIDEIEKRKVDYLDFKNNYSIEEFEIWYREKEFEEMEKEILKLKQELETNQATKSQYNTNVELLRKLSPSTWCTASGMASHYVKNYDNYLLIINGITVAGIEAGNIGDNGKVQVKEVTSRANNGIASVDHIDDIVAFFEKHNIDLDNNSIQMALEAKKEGITDAEMFSDEEEYYEDNMYPPNDYNPNDFYDFDDDNDDPGLEYRRNSVQEDLDRRTTVVENLNTVEEVLQNPDFLEFFDFIKPILRNNEEIARRGVESNPYYIMYIESNLPFYNDLAAIAVKTYPDVFQYLPQEIKDNPAIKKIYDDSQIEKANKAVIERLGVADLSSEQLRVENRQPDSTLNTDLPFSKTNQNLIQGYYDVNTDKVVVVASNISVEEAPRIAIHEVAHRGIVRMAKDLGGIEELSQILFAAENQLMEKLPILLNRTGHKSLEALILDYGFTTDSKEGKVKLLIELMARWAETLVDKPKPTWWRELISNIRNWITKFTGKTLSETEVNELVGGFVRYGTQQSNENTYYQKITDTVSPFEQMSKTDQVAFEKTVRDLAARMSDRIGIPYKIINNTNEKYKGKLSNGIAYINLAYCDMSTISHEVLGHSIIRALKNKSELSFKEQLNKEVYQGNIEKKC